MIKTKKLSIEALKRVIIFEELNLETIIIIR